MRAVATLVYEHMSTLPDDFESMFVTEMCAGLGVPTSGLSVVSVTYSTTRTMDVLVVFDIDVQQCGYDDADDALLDVCKLSVPRVTITDTTTDGRSRLNTQSR